MHKILGIGGSPRKGGNSDILIKRMLLGAKQPGVSTEEVQIRDYHIKPCIVCERCRKDGQCKSVQDGMQLLYPKIIEADGLIIVTPVHNYNMTAILKVFIDRLSCFYYLEEERPGCWKSRLADKRRKAIISAVGEQKELEKGGITLTLSTLHLSFEGLGYEIFREFPVPGIFLKGKIKEYPSLLRKAEIAGKQLAASLKLSS